MWREDGLLYNRTAEQCEAVMGVPITACGYQQVPREELSVSWV